MTTHRAPVRASHTYRQTLAGTPGRVLPLLCPVREMEWVPGWAPRLVLSESGVAERDCVFITAEGEREATWVITEHDPSAGVVEMLKVVPGYLVTRLHIHVQAAPGGRSYADVTYAYTALAADGEEYVVGRTEAAYGVFMAEWESAMNTYLLANPPAQPEGGER